MTARTIVTPSAQGSAGTTLHGEAVYTPVSSGRSVSTVTAPVSSRASDAKTQELRRRLRGKG